jgi:high affinity Mn2+ porin
MLPLRTPHVLFGLIGLAWVRHLLFGLIGLAWVSQTAGQSAGDEQKWQAKFQTTYIFQKKPPFPAAYTGPNSLVPDRERSYTVTATAYLGLRPWRDGEVFLVPEVTQGLPFSGLTGLAGFNNGELTRASGTNLRPYRQKLYLRQTWNFGGSQEKLDADLEQFPGSVDKNRFVLTVGNFAALDIFDDNAYAKDPRSQFMNWGNMTYAAYDYAADSRGFSWGLAGEWYHADWAARLGRLMVPRDPNQLSLDHRLASHYGDQLELEHGHTFAGQPGKIRLLVYRDRARLASYQDAIVYLANNPNANPQAIFAVRTVEKINMAMA